jgi:hypothetical protein
MSAPRLWYHLLTPSPLRMAKAFQVATDAATVKFNLAVGFNWQVTLGGNRTIVIGNPSKGDQVTIMLVQDGTGNRTVTWPANVKWASGQAPALQTAAGAVDLFVLDYDGTNFREVSGGGSRLPARIASVGLGTILGIGVTVLTLVSSNGNGGRVGTASLSDIDQGKTGSGANQETVFKDTASGSHVIGASGSLVIGSPTLNEKGTDAKAFIDKNGNGIFKGTLSGASLRTNIPTAAVGHLKCYKTGGVEGYCTSSGHTLGDCTCN